jgi:tRNA (cmo5U34)-methyltransferase
MASPDVNLWTSPEHALDYLQRADSIPHRTEGEAELLECLPPRVNRFLDLGTGDGRLLHLVKLSRPSASAVALDFSPTMLERVRARFANSPEIEIHEHDLQDCLPPLGKFDAVVSSFAIHHLTHPRKRQLYAEIFAVLNPGGVFCNLEHVASPTETLHRQFLQKIGYEKDEDPSNKLLDLHQQLVWLREIGFQDVDCLWKWRELALMVAIKP